MTYTPSDFLWMVNDAPRVDAYAAALHAVVRPGDRVVDLGAGFGFLSVVACRAGASHVDAIDINPVVTFGPRVAAANGFTDAITFHHADAQRVMLAQRADVIVGDMRGALPLAGDHLVALVSARHAMLRPGGRLIAQRDDLWVAPCVASSAFRSEVVEPSSATLCDVGPLQRHLRTVPYRTTALLGDLLGAGRPWASIDYERVSSPDAGGEAELVVERDGTLDALVLWFDTVLAPGIGFSNAPGTALRSYRQVLLPLRASVAVRAGDRLHVSLRAVHTARGYVWHWRGDRSGTPDETLFDQNSLEETILDTSLLPPPPDAELPSRGPRADALTWLLGRMGEGGTLREAAGEVYRLWPAMFATPRAAQTWVQQTVQRLEGDERGAE